MNRKLIVKNIIHKKNLDCQNTNHLQFHCTELNNHIKAFILFLDNVALF